MDGFHRAVGENNVSRFPVGVVLFLFARIIGAEDEFDAIDDDGAAEIDDEFGIVMLTVTP